MSYANQIEELAWQIGSEARALRELQKERASWLTPGGKAFYVGNDSHYVVRKDGSVCPGLEGVQREAVKLHDERIIAANSRIEGLRFKLVNLAKTGGNA